MIKCSIFMTVLVSLLIISSANATTYIYEFGGSTVTKDPWNMLGIDNQTQLSFEGRFTVETDETINDDSGCMVSNFYLNIGEYVFWNNQNPDSTLSWDYGWSTIGESGMAANIPLENVYWYETWVHFDGTPTAADLSSFSGGYIDIVCGTFEEDFHDVYFSGNIDYFTRHSTENKPVPEPSIMFLLGSGLIFLVRKKRKL